MKVAAVLPAYNEGSRVLNVLRSVMRAPSVDEVIVVNDGSTDDTADIIRSMPGVCLVDLPVNRGKGGAMTAGAQATDAEILLFLDADLIGLKVEHVERLIAPVKCGDCKMAVGQFKGGRKLTDWSQKLVPNISGQRAIRRDVFEQIPNLAYTRYGVEMAITRFCRYYRIPTVSVLLPGVTHPMKEEKLGFLRGAASRARMYWQILRIMLDPRPPRRKGFRRVGLINRIVARRKLARRAAAPDAMPRTAAFVRHRKHTGPKPGV